MGTVASDLQNIDIEINSLEMKGPQDILRVLWQLFKIIRLWEPDVVQTWMYHADLLGGLAARAAGNRNLIWGVRTTDVEAGGRRGTTLVRNLCACLSRWVPQKIICAAEAARLAHVEAGYAIDRMMVVPNGFDLSRLVATASERSALRFECGFGADEVVVGILGRFNEEKDHENFVQAAGLVAQRFANVRFLLVGRGLEASNMQLGAWISDTGYADRFVMIGQRSDVPSCLAAMDIFCLSSKTEGFPNAVGEAMAVGVPCVVTDVGDAAMLVGNTGLVVKKQDARALANGLAQLLETPREARAELGRKAQERIRTEFTIDRARERFEAAYNVVLQCKNR
jgi:glycosyltransferase involved in cell wall biosynthesis